MLAVFACRNEEMKNVILTGTLSQVPLAKKVFQALHTMHGVNFIIPKNAIYATATGAALSYLHKKGKAK
jgi:type II pantothenate kinase